jgi:hypothetical protein
LAGHKKELQAVNSRATGSARRGQNRSVLGVVITHFVAEASPHPQSRGPPWLRRASADPISAGAAFSDIALSIRYVQLTSSIAQQAQQMSAVLPDQARKALLPHTRRHAYGSLRSADSSAFRNGARSPSRVLGDQLKLKRMFDSHNTASSKIPGCVIQDTRLTCRASSDFFSEI